MTALARVLSPLLLSLLAPSEPSLLQESAPALGDELHHKFGRAFLSSPNPGALRNLRGRPVLLQWWHPEDTRSVEETVPAALSLAEKRPELVAILVGAGRLSGDRAERFAFDQGWMGGPALWTTDSPLEEPEPEPSAFVLLDTHGRILARGDALEQQDGIERLVRDQIDAAEELPEDWPRAFDRCWEAMVEGEFGKASNTAQELAEDPGLSKYVLLMQGEVLARVLSEQAWIDALVAIGRYDEAIERLEDFAQGTEDLAGWGSDAAEQLAELESDAFAPEVKASKRFAKLFDRVCGRGLERAATDLERFTEEHLDTVAADRAAHLLTLLEVD